MAIALCHWSICCLFGAKVRSLFQRADPWKNQPQQLLKEKAKPFLLGYTKKIYESLSV
jgi:DNA-binding XRE family transcriptional regulator